MFFELLQFSSFAKSVQRACPKKGALSKVLRNGKKRKGDPLNCFWTKIYEKKSSSEVLTIFEATQFFIREIRLCLGSASEAWAYEVSIIPSFLHYKVSRLSKKEINISTTRGFLAFHFSVFQFRVFQCSTERFAISSQIHDSQLLKLDFKLKPLSSNIKP